MYFTKRVKNIRLFTRAARVHVAIFLTLEMKYELYLPKQVTFLFIL